MIYQFQFGGVPGTICNNIPYFANEKCCLLFVRDFTITSINNCPLRTQLNMNEISKFVTLSTFLGADPGYLKKFMDRDNGYHINRRKYETLL
jgi:hypothetical protein